MIQHETVEPGKLDPRLALLKQWQADRLKRTYEDVAALPRYGAVMDFFLQDIYAARDFTQRNHDMERMYEFMRHVAPEPVVRPLMMTVELHRLSEDLDARLLGTLVGRLNMDGSLTTSLYTEAYRLCDNYPERVRQIELIHDIGVMLDRAVRLPMGGPMLLLAKRGLGKGGWSELIALMDRGYNVFKRVPDTGKLMAIIRRRELQILDRIYAGDSEPFDLTDD